MSTTTIRLPDALKERVARAAERAGTTAHNFMVEAIAEKAEQDERRAEFLQVANERYQDVIESGLTIPWKDMQDYLQKRIAEPSTPIPKARRLTRSK